MWPVSFLNLDVAVSVVMIDRAGCSHVELMRPAEITGTCLTHHCQVLSGVRVEFSCNTMYFPVDMAYPF